QHDRGAMVAGKLIVEAYSVGGRPRQGSSSRFAARLEHGAAKGKPLLRENKLIQRCTNAGALPLLTWAGRWADARIVRDTRERCLERVATQAWSKEVVVAHIVANRQQGDAARREPRRQRGAKAHAAVGQHALQLGVLGAGGRAIGGEEEGRRSLGQPVGELVD